MKLFLAAEIPQETIQTIHEQTDELRRDYPQFNWVPDKNMHVTVYFFGDRPEDRIPPLVEQVERASFDIPPLTLFSLESALFINTSIILHIALQRNKDLEKIHERLEDVYGEQKTRNKWKYVPHITLARYKLPSKQQYFHLKKKLSKLGIDMEFTIERLHLFKSISKPTNPEYVKLHTFELQEH